MVLPVSGIGQVGASRPFPDVPEQLAHAGLLPSGPAPPGRRMEAAVLQKVALQRIPLLPGGPFPFRLGRQAPVLPTGIGVRFIEADVGYRLCRVQGTGSSEGDDLPIAVTPVPIEGRPPSVLDDGVPTIGEPQQGFPVPAVLHEIEILPARHGAILQPVVGKPSLVTGPLVVPGESPVGSPHLEHPGFELVKCWRGGLNGASGSIPVTGPIGRPQGIARQDVLDVGDQQLLMLLLVVQPQLHQARELGITTLLQPTDQAHHLLVDLGAVGIDLLHRRPGQSPSNVPGHALSKALVVRIEDEVIARMTGPIVVGKFFQDHALEEPGGVTQVPLGRTDVRHGLYYVVLGAERPAEIPGGLPDRLKRARQLGSIHGRG